MKGNLLLIDDEAVLIECLRTVLEDHADHIYTASNGEEGYKTYKENPIHCIVCDIDMPVMNGVDLIKKLRAEDCEIPFIFYAGHGTRELMLDAAKYGAFDFLDKTHLTGLDEVVKRALAISTNTKPATPDDFMSDFQKMLEDLED